MRRRSFWRDVLNGLAGRMQCPDTRRPWGQASMRCDLDFRHQGLHTHEDGEGAWVWSSNGWYSMFIPRHGSIEQTLTEALTKLRNVDETS